MNWIFYSLINIAKIVTIVAVLLLSTIALPIFTGIFVFGMLLGFLRDVETHIPQYMNKTHRFHFPDFKFDELILWPTKVMRLQQVWIQRNRPKY